MIMVYRFPDGFELKVGDMVQWCEGTVATVTRIDKTGRFPIHVRLSSSTITYGVGLSTHLIRLKREKWLKYNNPAADCHTPPVLSPAKEVYVAPRCTCDTKLLYDEGCQCKYAEWKRRQGL